MSKIFPILNILTHSENIRDQSRKFCKINPKFTDGKTFRGESHEILDLQYKADADIDHVAKFRGDRPTELGDPAVAN